MEATGTPTPATGAVPGQQVGEAIAGGAAPVPGQQPGDIKAAAAEAARKLKIKYDDGKEEEVDEAEVLRTYRERKKHQSVASRELNEGKKLRSQAEEFVKMLKDPDKLWEVARKLGHDPRKLSEAQLARALEEELLDPTEKELRDLRRRVEENERKEKEKEERVKAQRLAEVTKKYEKEYTEAFIEAIDKTGIPKDKDSVAAMAGYVHRAAKIGYKLSAEEAAKLVAEDLEQKAYTRVRSLEGEALIKALGEETVAKLRKYDVSNLKNPASVLSTPIEQVRREKQSGKRPSSREWQLKKRGLA